jgi:hypothetical protein
LSATPTAFWLLVFGLPLVLATFLIRAGRKRWIGSDPHCRACNYILHGLQSNRCPECGATLSPTAIQHGQPRRRWGPFLSGWLILIFLAIFTISGGISALRDIEWYHYKPTHFVMEDLNSGQPTIALRAWTELMRRDSAGSLAASTRDDLVKYALLRQANAQPPFTALDTATVNYLGARCLAGDLPKDQQTKFFEQCFRIRLAVRAKVILGDYVPYLVIHEGIGPTQSFFAPGLPSFWTKVILMNASIDGKKESRSGGVSSESMGFGAGTMGSSVNCSVPGKHQLDLTIRIEISHGQFGPAGLPTLYEAEQTISANFEVLATKPDNLIQATSQPSMTAGLRAAFTPSNFRFDSKNMNMLEGNIGISGAPQNLAYDVIAVYGGKEHNLSTIAYKMGSGMWSYGVNGTVTPPPPATVNIILRPSEKAARESVDLYGYWSQELVFPNVPVSRQ